VVFCFKKLVWSNANCLASVGIRSPERCASFAVGKGEHREGRGGGKFRQEFYRNPNSRRPENFCK